MLPFKDQSFLLHPSCFTTCKSLLRVCWHLGCQLRSIHPWSTSPSPAGLTQCFPLSSGSWSSQILYNFNCLSSGFLSHVSRWFPNPPTFHINKDSVFVSLAQQGKRWGVFNSLRCMHRAIEPKVTKGQTNLRCALCRQPVEAPDHGEH